jgi:hypothetical protein
MAISQIPSSHRTGVGDLGTDSGLPESLPFTSRCPRCMRLQPQRGFPQAALRRLLAGGFPVEAYCVMCDQFWPISASERQAIAEALGE